MKNMGHNQVIIWICISLFTIQLGCAHTPPQPASETVREQFGTIGIVSARFIPEATRGTFAKECELSDESNWSASGAASGAATGAAGGLELALEIATSGNDPMSLALGLILAPFLILGGALGGAAAGGTGGAVKREGVAQEISVINDALPELKIQETMAEHVLKTCKELEDYRFDLVKDQGPTSPEEKLTYEFLSEKGMDAALEVSVVSLLYEARKDMSIGFSMTVRTRLIRTIDGTEVNSRKFEYKSANENFINWMDIDAQKLREEFDCFYKSLAETIVEEMFLLADLPLGSKWEGTRGLRPMYPELSYDFEGDLKYLEVVSRQPELQWEAFPRPEDREADDTGVLSRITDITYDLKIWKAYFDLPGELVYTRKGLSAPSHKTETPLSPMTTYFWNIRLRFKMDGYTRVSHWALSDGKFQILPCLWEN